MKGKDNKNVWILKKKKRKTSVEVKSEYQKYIHFKCTAQ